MMLFTGMMPGMWLALLCIAVSCPSLMSHVIPTETAPSTDRSNPIIITKENSNSDAANSTVQPAGLQNSTKEATSDHISDNTNETSLLPCGNHSLQVTRESLDRLQMAIEAGASLVKIRVRLNTSTFDNTPFKFHWVIDKKGDFNHKNLISPYSWLAVKLGMFQEGVFNMAMDLSGTGGLINKTQDDRVKITQMCITDLTEIIFNRMKQGDKIEITNGKEEPYTSHIINDEDIMLVMLDIYGFTFNFSIFFIVCILFTPTFILKYLSRPIPKVCYDNGDLERMHLSINPLPIGLKYSFIYWKPWFRFKQYTVIKISLMFIFFIVFPDIYCIITNSWGYGMILLSVRYLSYFISFWVVLLKFWEPSFMQKVSLRSNNRRTLSFSWSNLKIVYKIELQKTVQHKIETILNNTNHTLKVLINANYWRVPIYWLGREYSGIVYVALMIITIIWLPIAWIYLCLIGITKLDFMSLGKSKEFKQLSLVLRTLIFCYSIGFAICILEETYIIEIVLYLLILLLSAALKVLSSVGKRIKFAQVHILIGCCISHLFIFLAWTIFKYISICESLVSGLLLDTHTVGTTCFLIVAGFGIFIKATVGFYDLYCQLFRLTVQAAENVYKDLKQLQMNVESQVLIESAHGSNYNRSLQQISMSDTVINHRISLLMKYSETNEPTIEMDLFWTMVKKHRPLFYTMFIEFLCKQIIPYVLLIYFIRNILNDADLTDMTLFASRTFLTIVVTGIIPLVWYATRSPETDKCESISKERQYELDILAYIVHGRVYEPLLDDPEPETSEDDLEGSPTLEHSNQIFYDSSGCSNEPNMSKNPLDQVEGANVNLTSLADDCPCFVREDMSINPTDYVEAANQEQAITSDHLGNLAGTKTSHNPIYKLEGLHSEHSVPNYPIHSMNSTRYSSRCIYANETECTIDSNECYTGTDSDTQHADNPSQVHQDFHEQRRCIRNAGSYRVRIKTMLAPRSSHQIQRHQNKSRTNTLTIVHHDADGTKQNFKPEIEDCDDIDVQESGVLISNSSHQLQRNQAKQKHLCLLKCNDDIQELDRTFTDGNARVTKTVTTTILSRHTSKEENGDSDETNGDDDDDDDDDGDDDDDEQSMLLANSSDHLQDTHNQTHTNVSQEELERFITDGQDITNSWTRHINKYEDSYERVSLASTFTHGNDTNTTWSRHTSRDPDENEESTLFARQTKSNVSQEAWERCITDENDITNMWSRHIGKYEDAGDCDDNEIEDFLLNQYII